MNRLLPLLSLNCIDTSSCCCVQGLLIFIVLLPQHWLYRILLLCCWSCNVSHSSSGSLWPLYSLPCTTATTVTSREAAAVVQQACCRSFSSRCYKGGI
jgi:hypothetical protein